MNFRAGFGFDVHRLEEGKDLFIGGVKIPHYKGAVAHSDGDCLIHAICDAILGAAALRDIGWHFPDTSAEYKGIDSKKLLKKVVSLIAEKGYVINNIDTTVCLQKPKLSEYIPEMRKILSQTTGIAEDDISVKATTTENLGFVGKEEGISAYAVVTIHSSKG